MKNGVLNVFSINSSNENTEKKRAHISDYNSKKEKHCFIDD